MTRNQEIMVEILPLIKTGMDCSIQYNSSLDMVNFYYGYDNVDGLENVNIYDHDSDTKARAKFVEIVAEIGKLEQQQEESEDE